MAAGEAVAVRVVAAVPVVVAGAALAAVAAVLGAVAEDLVVEDLGAEDLVVEAALPGVPAEGLEPGPLGEQGLPAERAAAAVGQQPEAALLPGRAAPRRAAPGRA